jgi:hypothetical protein
VTITIDLDKELIPGQREARAPVVAAGSAIPISPG